MKLSSLTEVQRRVLSWGGDAVVLKPKELAESVKTAAKKSCKLAAKEFS